MATRTITARPKRRANNHLHTYAASPCSRTLASATDRLIGRRGLQSTITLVRLVTLQDLDVPLYIHPNAVPADQWKVVQGYPAMDTAMWSWAPRTGGHAMRLILGGVFDRYPNARVILGHMGEFLPFQLSRLDFRYKVLDFKHPLKKLPSEYFRTNIAITTTGVFSHAVLIAAIGEVGVDNVMFSIDYPFESTEKAVQFIRTAPLAPADQARVAHVNAEQMLRLNQ